MELTSPLQDGPFNRLPHEVISKIFVAVVNITPIAKRLNETLRSPSKMPMLLCHVSSPWRKIALRTPELWEHLCAFIPVHIEEPDEDAIETDEILVWKQDLEFLAWWSRNLMQGRNKFALRLHLDHLPLLRPSPSRVMTLFAAEDTSTFLNLASRARYLDADSALFPFLQLMPSAFPDGELCRVEAHFPYLESLVLTRKQSHTKYDYQFQRIPFHNMQALRKICLMNLSLHDPLGAETIHTGVQDAFGLMWARLTHIQLTLRVTVADWQMFIRGCTSLQSASIHLFVHDGFTDEDMDTGPDLTFEDEPDPNFICLPNLYELSLVVQDSDDDDTGKLLQNLHLPSLRTLLLWCNILTLKSFHRLLGATPNVEQIRLCSLFPAVSVDDSDPFTELFGVDNGYYLHFPQLDSSGQAKSTSLVHYTPRLKKIMLDIPNTRQFKRSVRDYVRNMLLSGWLKGPWKNGPLHVEFFWNWLSERVHRWPVIQDLKHYLAEGTIRWDGDENGQDMDIRVRVKYDQTNYEEDEDVPLWQRWFRLDADF